MGKKTFIGLLIAIVLVAIGSYVYYYTDFGRQESSDQKFNVALEQNVQSLKEYTPAVGDTKSMLYKTKYASYGIDNMTARGYQLLTVYTDDRHYETFVVFKRVR